MNPCFNYNILKESTHTSKKRKKQACKQTKQTGTSKHKNTEQTSNIRKESQLINKVGSKRTHKTKTVPTRMNNRAFKLSNKIHKATNSRLSKQKTRGHYALPAPLSPLAVALLPDPQTLADPLAWWSMFQTHERLQRTLLKFIRTKHVRFARGNPLY